MPPTLNSSIVKFSVAEWQKTLPPHKPVPIPLGVPISLVRSAAVSPPSNANASIGLWECSPGRWRRQVVKAEFCHFLEGECSFTPDDGTPIEIGVGDVLYFPANSKGVWDIRTASRKIFMTLDEA